MNNMYKKKYNFAMIATYLRIILSPVIGYFILLNTAQGYCVAFLLFIPTALTDWLDGYLSRKFDEESQLGKLMDPIADKILVQICIFSLSYNHVISPIILIILLIRNSFISGLRAIAASNQIIISARPLGKLKTGLQMVSIPSLLIYQYLDINRNEDLIFNWLTHIPFIQTSIFFNTAYSLLWISSILSIISGLEYSWRYFQQKT